MYVKTTDSYSNESGLVLVPEENPNKEMKSEVAAFVVAAVVGYSSICFVELLI